MAVRRILIWPDPELLRVSAKVDVVDASVKALVQDMFDSMYAADGVGLAAPQIGVRKRVVILDIRSYQREQLAPGPASAARADLSGLDDGGLRAGGDGEKVDVPADEEPLVLINPELSNKAGDLEWEEGCLSVPGETGLVTRAARCTVKYLGLDGAEHVLEAEGLKSVAIQHECDHLDGKLFVDYLSRLKRSVIKKKMLRLMEERAAAE
jgi:peptide deformylase